jgi:ATP-dependent Zn protease
VNQSLLNILISWAPMLLIIAVWIFLIYRMRSGPYLKSQTDWIAAAKRQADALERIANILEKKAL